MAHVKILLLPLVSCLIGSACHSAQFVVVTEFQQIEWMFGTWVGDQRPLEMDIEDFAVQGDPVSSRFTFKQTPNSEYVFGTLLLTKGDQQKEMFRDVWGPQPASEQLHRWAFFWDGVVFDGPLFVNGDRVIQRIEGKARPVGEQLKKLAEKVGLGELPFSAEVIFRRIDDDSMSVMVDKVTVAGIPFPWPGAGKPDIARRVQ